MAGFNPKVRNAIAAKFGYAPLDMEEDGLDAEPMQEVDEEGERVPYNTIAKPGSAMPTEALEMGATPDMRQGQAEGNLISNMGRAFSNAARGTSAPSDNSALFNAIDSQNASLVKQGTEDLNRRAKVMQAVAAQRAKAEAAQNAKAQGQSEWDRRNSITSKQALERVKMMAGVKLDAERSANPNKFEFDRLPPENQEMIKELSKKNANKVGIANQIDQYVKAIDDPALSSDQKLLQARQAIKVLNSTEGQDAVGAEEAKRLAGLLEFQMFNILEPGNFIGRDVEGFGKQAAETAKGLRGAAKSNESQITRLKGGKGLDLSGPPQGPKPGDVDDGHRFKGGNPADPANWEKL